MPLTPTEYAIIRARVTAAKDRVYERRADRHEHKTPVMGVEIPDFTTQDAIANMVRGIFSTGEGEPE